jgi:acyl-CoA dehydrogenase
VSRTGPIAFDLSDEVDEVLVGLRSFVDREVVTRHERAGPLLEDARRRFSPDGLLRAEILDLVREVRVASSAAGYYTMFVPETVGGGGLGSEALYRVWEDLHHHYGPRYWLMGWVVAHWARGPSHVLVHATPAARERVLPDLLSGRTSMCFAMSEPDAGSDARMMRTRAEPDGPDWVISGSKIWITNGPYAEHAVVFARVDGAPGAPSSGISAFLVPTDSPGFSTEGSIRMFGEVGGDEALLHFDRVRVGPEMVLGAIGQGFPIAMSGVTSGRLYNSARAVGLGRWALEQATAYAVGREAFGRPVAEHQGVAFPLAESATELHAAHLMGLNCALLLDSGTQATKELSMAKAFSTEAAVRAVDRAIQVHGAIGFTNELGLVEAFHTVRKACVADGTAEILRRAIARRLFGGDLDL